MERKKSNDTVTQLIILFIAVGVGTFICNILERTDLNVWIARGIGAFVTVIVGISCGFIIRKLKTKKEK